MDKTLLTKGLLALAIFVLCSITAFSQNISLECKNTPVEQILSNLEKQTNYSFVYQKRCA